MGKDRAVGRQLRTLIELGAVAELGDGQLLERFASSRGEAAELAFAEIVERHGPMVLRVCRSVLDDPHDSDDAFQATFLVLVARGRELWVRDSLGPWLHQVAHRTARCARSNAARRKRLELRASLVRGNVEKQTQPESSGEPERALLEEIDRLPERYRAPVVLCDLEGRTHEAAARALGWPIGTVKSRQARARDRLRDRLRRRGFAPASGLALLDLPRSIPTVLVNSTTRLAVRSVASGALARGSAAWIAQEVIRSMMILRSVKLASLVIALGAAGSGAGILAQGAGGGPVKPVAQAEAKPRETPQAAEVDKSAYQVKPGRLEVTEQASGYLEPSKSVDIQSQVESRTQVLHLKPDGTKVHQGEVLAELDATDLKNRRVDKMTAFQQAESMFNQARLVREVAELAVKESLEGLLPAERTRMKAKISDAERNVKDGEARLERTRVARKKLDDMFATTKGPATPADIVADLNVNDLIESAGRNLSDQKQALELAKEQLVQFEKFTAEMRTRTLQIEVERAKRDEADKKTAWESVRNFLTYLDRQIENCRLVAPADGTFTYANDQKSRLANGVDIQEGVAVQTGTIIGRVIDTDSPMIANVKVREHRVDQILPGHRTSITIIPLKGLTFGGTVLDVAGRIDEQTYNQTKQKLYTTRIKLDQALPRQRPGMPAKATIVIQALDNVLTVPLACVANMPEGGYQVIVKTPQGTLEPRTVTIGAANDEFAEVKSGLKAGELLDLDRRNH